MAETHTISAEEAKARQYRQDAEYLKACELHGIEPAPPSYRGSGYCFAGTSVDDAILNHRQSTLDGGAITQCDSDADIDQRLGWHEPDETLDSALEIHAEAERALTGILNLLIPANGRISAQGVGAKLLALAWLIQHPSVGGLSQTQIADKIGMTRANLSAHVRALQKQLNGRLHARGQKTEVSNQHYREARLRVVAEGRNLRRKVD
jgi:hypothetical protein